MLIHAALDRSARLHAGHLALRDAERAVTYAALRALSCELAGALAAAGVERGERVALLSKNRVEYAAAYFACSRLGAALVPLNWRLRAGELAQQLADSEARAVLAEGPLAAALDGAPEVERARARVALGDALAGWTRFDEFIAGATPLAEPRVADEQDAVVQMYTSGTTGAPKGALLTHRNLLSLTRAWLFDMPLAPERSRFLQVTPLFHVGGLLMLLSAASAGATLELLPEFEPAAAARCLAERGITHTLMVPAMLRWLLDEPSARGRGFPELELVVYGAAPMPEAVLARALERFRCGFLQGYGLTETAGVLTTLRPEDHLPRARGAPSPYLASAGRAVLCSEVRVVDDAGADVAAGEVGEVVARGPNVTPGYWKRPEETVASFRDGWFRTGDLGRQDERGYLTLVDRAKDMLIVGGENVYPREVELALLQHPAVADCAVIGIPHADWGEEVLAYVVPAEGTEPDGRELVRFCRERLARFKCPTKVERVSELPRNAAGKVLKQALRAPWWEGRARRV